MRIQKYKANITNTSKEVVGYVSEVRRYIGEGCYSNEVDLIINVTEISMPNGNYGSFIIDKSTLKEFYECPVCLVKEQNSQFNNLTCSQKCYDEL